MLDRLNQIRRVFRYVKPSFNGSFRPFLGHIEARLIACIRYLQRVKEIPPLTGRIRCVVQQVPWIIRERHRVRRDAEQHRTAREHVQVLERDCFLPIAVNEPVSLPVQREPLAYLKARVRIKPVLHIRPRVHDHAGNILICIEP